MWLLEMENWNKITITLTECIACDTLSQTDKEPMYRCHGNQYQHWTHLTRSVPYKRNWTQDTKKEERKTRNWVSFYITFSWLGEILRKGKWEIFLFPESLKSNKAEQEFPAGAAVRLSFVIHVMYIWLECWNYSPWADWTDCKLTDLTAG